MTVSARNYVTALAAAAVIAVALSACGGNGVNGVNGNGPVINGPPEPTDVDLSRVTPGFMAEAEDDIEIDAGDSVVHGDIEFSCAAGGDDCVVMVMVDSDGDITATSTGGTVSAGNSDAYNMRIRVTNEANSIHAATGLDLVRGDDPLEVRWTTPATSGSDYVGVWASVTPPENTFGRSSRAIPWVNRAGEVHFDITVNSGLSQSELDPLAWLGRSFYTTDISAYSEGTDHALGNDWKVFDAEKNYDGTGSLTARIATDVHSAGTVQRPFVGYGDFDRNIVLSEDDVPALPAGRDWQGVNVVGGVEGSIDGVQGEFTCDTGITECYLETSRNADAEGYYPYDNVVFTRDDNGASEVLPAANYSTTVPTTDYLVFGTWQYVPEDITAAGDYEFGVFAGGGDPFRGMDVAADLYGTATYNGGAHGMYYTGRASKTPAVGSFDARVTLEADFGNMADTFDYGRLSGTVNNIRYSGTTSGLPTQLILGGEGAAEADIFGSMISMYDEEIAAVGVATDGQPTPAWSGTWQATFYGNGANPQDHPTGVAGTFGATNDTDGLVGAFGARRQ